MKKILVVDDEQDIRKLLEEYLEMEGYSVHLAKNGIEALQQLEKVPDLILLDINMPDMDGYSVCEAIRNYIDCPILFLTARTEQKDQINGFKVGGDDYIIKPFSIDELSARIEAHLRREDRQKNNIKRYENQELMVDFFGHNVQYKDQIICLTKTEYMIVELLITHTGQVFDKEKIYEYVRGFDGEADASIITEHVRRIRKKLGQVCEKEYIETVWGVGYKWIG